MTATLQFSIEFCQRSPSGAGAARARHLQFSIEFCELERRAKEAKLCSFYRLLQFSIEFCLIAQSVLLAALDDVLLQFSIEFCQLHGQGANRRDAGQDLTILY